MTNEMNDETLASGTTRQPVSSSPEESNQSGQTNDVQQSVKRWQDAEREAAHESTKSLMKALNRAKLKP